MGRKLYVTVNTVFEEREGDRLYQLLNYLAALGPDGLIVQDFGILCIVKEWFPGLKLLASTQMNIASARGVNFLSRQGFSRAILARELSLEEIRTIRGRTNLELEVFVHGALCVSASGLCLFSSYLGGKSANRGLCTQACRRFYHSGEEGGYYFSPADLELLDQTPDLVDAGVNSFKIEGRMKSAAYVGTVVSAYRRVLDSLGGSEEELRKAKEEGRRILQGDFARSKTVFYFNQGMPSPGRGLPDKPEWLNPAQSGGTGIFLGTLLRVKGAGEDRQGLLPPGPLFPVPGDSVRFHRADDSDRQSHKLKAAVPAEGAGETGFWVSIPEGFGAGDDVYLIQTKALSKRYAPVIPPWAAGFARGPGRERAPSLTLPPVRRPSPGPARRKVEEPFPPGIYIAFSRIEELYLAQAARPEGVILFLGPGLASGLLEKKPAPLPFSPGELILSLDPFFPEAADASLEEDLRRLMEGGYRRFILNTPGQFSFFRNKPCSLIAGPYLYMFNRWAQRFLAGEGVDYFVSPLENNRQNLERTVETGRRPFTFITVLAWPALFRIRADLRGAYGFEEFQDSRGEGFHLVSGPEGSRVYPERPFSLLDKLPFLREAGFGRFILDLAGGGPVKKGAYRDLMNTLRTAAPLPGAARFNWKDGFYQNPTAGGPGSCN
jgi:putative protease